MFSSLLTFIRRKIFLWYGQIRLYFQKPNNRLIGKKYLEIEFQQGGKTYLGYLCRNQKYFLKNFTIRGLTTQKIYPFHPGFIPPINASDFEEEAFEVIQEDGEVEKISSLEKFCFQK